MNKVFVVAYKDPTTGHYYVRQHKEGRLIVWKESSLEEFFDQLKQQSDKVIRLEIELTK